jgi:chromosome segregation ATPase
MSRSKRPGADDQTDLLAQLRQSADKASEAERLRKGALQEAAFYRAKIATLESASFSDLSRIEKERIADLERQLGTLASEHGQMQREVERTRDAGTSDKALYEAALEREAESAQRAEDAEEAHRVTQEELEELRATTSTLESSLREQTERMITLNSTVQQRESERDHYQSRIDDAHAEKEKHMSMIDQVQAAIAAAGVRSAEVEESYRKATERISELEADLLEARQEAEARGRDADLAAERYAEVERAYTTSREEADSLRTATSGKLGELLDSHRDLLTNDARGGKMYQDQVRALEEEGKSLRKMLREAGQRLEDAEAGVSHHRSKTRDLENAHKALKGELRSARAKHVQVQQDLARNRELHATREGELRDRDAAVTEIETRCTVLRNICELCIEHTLGEGKELIDSGRTRYRRGRL